MGYSHNFCATFGSSYAGKTVGQRLCGLFGVPVPSQEANGPILKVVSWDLHESQEFWLEIHLRKLTKHWLALINPRILGTPKTGTMITCTEREMKFPVMKLLPRALRKLQEWGAVTSVSQIWEMMVSSPLCWREPKIRCDKAHERNNRPHWVTWPSHWTQDPKDRQTQQEVGRPALRVMCS